MNKEIEHKYLVKDDSYKKISGKCINIVQGYLSRDINKTIRIRKAEDKSFLTIKGRNDGDTRSEFEYEIPTSDFNQLLDLCEGRIIHKNRYIIEYKGYKWEIDEFLDELAPLVVAEIELNESYYDYPLPSFIGENVTNNPTYYNSNL